MVSESRIEALEQRVHELEAKEAIRELRHNYAYYADNGDWEGFLSLFTEDASIEYSDDNDRSSRHGKEELEEYTKEITKRVEFSAHMMHNPVITVEGDEARATWYFEVPELLADESALRMQGRYEEEYRLVNGEWRISCSRPRFNYTVDYDEGRGPQLFGKT